jgi:hypothetical protein
VMSLSVPKNSPSYANVHASPVGSVNVC